jgi:hypothetical protein
MIARQFWTSIVPCHLTYAQCWIRSRGMRAAAELSLTGGHVLFPCWFAIVSNPLWECVYSRRAQSSMHVMRGRLGPGVIVEVGENTCLCSWTVSLRYARAC